MSPLHRIALTLAALAAGAAFSAPGPRADDPRPETPRAEDPGPNEPDRGRALYEMRCTGCHDRSVHARKSRSATDFEAVRAWVARWTETLRTGWSADEIDDVARYLNGAYYRYPCPPTVCKVVSLMHVNPEDSLPTYLGRR